MALLQAPQAQEVVYNDQWDGPVYINQPNIVDVTRENPGRTYVGVLPGHSRPAFVRKRRSSCFRLPRLFKPQCSDYYSYERTYRCTVRSPSCYRSDPYHTTVVTDQPVYVNDCGPRPLPYGLKFATGKHRCGACGKFRSPSYAKRHPLTDGEQPKESLCRKCAKNSTEDSDDSYQQYRKEQKRRRRQAASFSDERWERRRKEHRYRSKGSGDYSYSRSHEEERYRGPRRRYSVDERNSYSDQESRRRPRIVYVDPSSSCGRTGSRSGSEASVAISFKSREPRRLRRRSRSRSSAEEIRVVRRIIEKPERGRQSRSSSMSERSYQHYRSRSGSSGRKSVRFESPRRRQRGRGYDGVVSYEEPAHEPFRKRPKPITLALEPPTDRDRRAFPDPQRPTASSSSGRQTHESDGSYAEELERKPSRSFRHLQGSSEIRDAAARYRRQQNGRPTSATSCMSGIRGRSLSDDRHALRRERSRERDDAGWRRVSRGRSSGGDDGRCAPARHSSSQRQEDIPIRASRLLQRLDQENVQDSDTTRNTSLKPEPRVVYRHVRGRSPTRQSSHSRQPSHSLRYSSSRHRSPSPYPRPANNGMGHEDKGSRRDRVKEHLRHDLKGKVRYVGAPRRP